AVKPLRRERRLLRLPCRCLRAQSAAFFARKTRGCGQHPVFPAPSDPRWAIQPCITRADSCRENAEVRLLPCEEHKRRSIPAAEALWTTSLPPSLFELRRTSRSP